MFKKLILVSALVLSLTNCTKEQMGTGLGALGGGVAGSAFGKGNGQKAMGAIGMIFGAAAGNAIGKSLDQADQKYYDQNYYKSLETSKTGSTMSWSNPDSGNHGVMVVNKTFQNQSGTYCREFTQKIYVGKDVQEGYGTACRQPDGAWKIVN